MGAQEIVQGAFVLVPKAWRRLSFDQAQSKIPSVSVSIRL